MPFKDDEKRRAYIREYMRQRRRGGDAPTPITNEADEQLDRQVREAWKGANNAREAMIEGEAQLAKLAHELIKERKALIEMHDTVVTAYNRLLANYNELVADYNELLDESDGEGEGE
jgi:hypothetical protein